MKPSPLSWIDLSTIPRWSPLELAFHRRGVTLDDGVIRSDRVRLSEKDAELGAYLYLGNFYDVGATESLASDYYPENNFTPDQIRFNETIWAQYHGEATDDQRALAILCSYNALDKRAQYRAQLGQAIKSAGADIERVVRLNQELSVWQALDMADVTNYISKYLGPIQTLLEDRHGHWVWPEPPHPRKRPAINWHGHKGVPVYKMLWPLVFPDDPLPVRSQKRAIKREAVCNDIEFRQCVNPMHYETVEPWTWMPGGKRGRHTDIKTGRSLKWTYIDNVKLVNGEALLHCPACNAVASSDFQAQVAAGVVAGTMRCQACIDRWKKANGFRKVRTGRKAIPNDERSIEDIEFEREIIREFSKAEHWDPFETSNPDDPA